MYIMTVLIAHTLAYLCMYLGTNVVTAASSPSVISSGIMIKAFTTPIVTTTTTSKAAVDNTVDANNAGIVMHRLLAKQSESGRYWLATDYRYWWLLPNRYNS